METVNYSNKNEYIRLLKKKNTFNNYGNILINRTKNNYLKQLHKRDSKKDIKIINNNYYQDSPSRELTYLTSYSLNNFDSKNQFGNFNIINNLDSKIYNLRLNNEVDFYKNKKLISRQKNPLSKKNIKNIKNIRSNLNLTYYDNSIYSTKSRKKRNKIINNTSFSCNKNDESENIEIKPTSNINNYINKINKKHINKNIFKIKTSEKYNTLNWNNKKDVTKNQKLFNYVSLKKRALNIQQNKLLINKNLLSERENSLITKNKRKKLLIQLKKNKKVINKSLKDLKYSLSYKSLSEYKAYKNNNKNKLQINIDDIKNQHFTSKGKDKIFNKSLGVIKLFGNIKKNKEYSKNKILNNNSNNINSQNYKNNNKNVDQNQYNKNVGNNKTINNIILQKKTLFRNNTNNLMKFQTKSFQYNNMNEYNDPINNIKIPIVHNIKNLLLKNMQNIKHHTILEKNNNKKNANIIDYKSNKSSRNEQNYNLNNIQILNNHNILYSKINPKCENLTEICLNQGKIINRLVGDVQNLNFQIEKKKKLIKDLNHQLDNYKKNKFFTLKNNIKI